MRNRKHILAVAIMLLIALALSACGQKGGSLEDKIVGKYTSAQMGTMIQGSLAAVNDKMAEVKVELEFKKGGQIDILLDGKEFSEFFKEQAESLGIKDELPDSLKAVSNMFKYSVEGEKVMLELGPSKQEVKVSFEGDKMIFEAEGEKLEFVKVK